MSVPIHFTDGANSINLYSSHIHTQHVLHWYLLVWNGNWHLLLRKVDYLLSYQSKQKPSCDSFKIAVEGIAVEWNSSLEDLQHDLHQ